MRTLKIFIFLLTLNLVVKAQELTLSKKISVFDSTEKILHVVFTFTQTLEKDTILLLSKWDYHSIKKHLPLSLENDYLKRIDMLLSNDKWVSYPFTVMGNKQIGPFTKKKIKKGTVLYYEMLLYQERTVKQMLNDQKIPENIDIKKISVIITTKGGLLVKKMEVDYP